MEQIKTKTSAQLSIKEPPLYKITFFNNDKTTMEGVILVLEQIFNYPYTEAIPLMLEIHQKDKAEVWEGPHDLGVQYTQAVLNYCLKAPEEFGLRYLRIELTQK